MKSFKVMGMVGAALLFSGGAMAQDTTTDNQQSQQLGEGAPRGETHQEKVDPRPTPPAPVVGTRTGVIDQAGAGSNVSYARAGVLELGGSAGFSAASNYTRFELEPSLGYFIVDNVQLSLLPSVQYFNVDSPSGSGKATTWKVLAEPSFHLPINPNLFGFLGVGAGVNYVSEQAGFALQPRIGAKIMVGRSGILTPSFNVAYSTVDAVRTDIGTVLAIQTQYSLNIGYTVMW
jgi:hypothetical protein